MTDPFAPSNREPASLMIGAYSAWCLDLSFDPALYLLKYAFLQGESRTELVGQNTDGRWTFIATSEFTADLANGRNKLDLVVVRLSDNETVIVKTSTIHCFSSQSDRTSHSQTMVDKIESILLGRADNDVDSYTIKSRSISKMSISELTDWRDYYLAELGREPNELTGKRRNNNTVKVGFI